MKYRDFCRQYELRETLPVKINSFRASDVIKEYIEKCGKVDLFLRTGDYVEDLLYEYFAVKGTDDEKILKELMEYYKFNYSMSIHNAIYYLLSNDKEVSKSIDPLSWPGILDIKVDGSKYILYTILGNIEVYKASEILKDSKSYYIFMKELMGQCYQRSYEFLKENGDYRAILSYMPNFFYGGHYHAYLKNTDSILDIASNAIYYDSEFSDKILCGDIIAELSYKQVVNKFDTLRNVEPKLPSKNKLLTLGLYYDIKKANKKTN